MPVNKDGAIHGYVKRMGEATYHRTNKMTRGQYFSYRRDWLFAEVMTQRVYYLTTNYRVNDKRFKKVLERVRRGYPSKEDKHHIVKLHSSYWELDAQFKKNIEHHDKTMWLYCRRQDVSDKNRDKLIETSRKDEVPVARLNCWYDTNKLQNKIKRRAVRSHFDMNSFVQHTDFCVGARVPLKNWNILPSAGLYSGAIGKIVEIVYSKESGPNVKEKYHLPDYVIVDFPHLNLPPHIQPWDTRHRTHVPIPMKTSLRRKG